MLQKTLESNDFVHEQEQTAADCHPHHQDQPAVAKGEQHRCIRWRRQQQQRRRDSSSSSDKNPWSNVSSSRCVICLDSYHEGDVVVWSNNSDHCTHCLHLECALDYFVYFWKDDSHPCPVCRQTFLLLPPAAQGAHLVATDGMRQEVVIVPQGNRDDEVPGAGPYNSVSGGIESRSP
jgi:hypothetical protein